MLTQFQMWNRNDLVLKNRIIKYLSIREDTFVCIRRRIQNTLTQSQMWNRKDLMLTNRNIKSLSSRENNFGSISGSIKNMPTQFPV